MKDQGDPPPAVRDPRSETDLSLDADLGVSGEAAFKLLCADVKAATHPGSPDARGFDFVAWLPHGALHPGDGARAPMLATASMPQPVAPVRHVIFGWGLVVSVIFAACGGETESSCVCEGFVCE